MLNYEILSIPAIRIKIKHTAVGHRRSTTSNCDFLQDRRAGQRKPLVFLSNLVISRVVTENCCSLVEMYFSQFVEALEPQYCDS